MYGAASFTQQWYKGGLLSDEGRRSKRARATDKRQCTDNGNNGNRKAKRLSGEDDMLRRAIKESLKLQQKQEEQAEPVSNGEPKSTYMDSTSRRRHTRVTHAKQACVENEMLERAIKESLQMQRELQASEKDIEQEHLRPIYSASNKLHNHQLKESLKYVRQLKVNCNRTHAHAHEAV